MTVLDSLADSTRNYIYIYIIIYIHTYKSHFTAQFPFSIIYLAPPRCLSLNQAVPGSGAATWKGGVGRSMGKVPRRGTKCGTGGTGFFC